MTPTVKPGWHDIELMHDNPAQSLTWVSTADAGGGKSYFGCTAPAPIWVAAFDPTGFNRVDKAVRTGKEIRITRMPFNASQFKTTAELQRHAKEMWLKFQEDYFVALKNVRTVLWDREDMAYKLQRYANFGDTSSAPKDYEDLYTEYVGLIQEAQAAGVNLGMLRGIKEKWISKWDAGKAKMVAHNTGEMIPEGMKKVNDHVDISLYHRWDNELKAYVTKIDKFTNPEFRGQEFPNLDFPTMATFAFPDSDESSWL
jgi:hypothetical protein